ncbi:antibiotic biosynthesis monooxygenase family protein [Rhizobium sp. SG570]|uniref:putative quinol monooxygenase n=1 Tax=Rhizobium sp. SG570 TaxID=2587113 RepID=UPI00144731A3|nr:antibiotic biosynthesis monooxygenase family protein [Rhizobium sp. SG570]NKJ39540.1 quinol monooxygenase YgiN [Rhizobium sp. SG570]
MSYIVVARWVARKEHQGEIERILREFVPRCLAEPGCRSFLAHQSVEKPNEFLLYEHYSEEKDFVDHQATSHFKELVLQRAVPLLESRERVPYEILA